MPLHDFKCPACGTVEVDVYVPVTVGASKAFVTCPRGCQTYEHLGPYYVNMVPIPAIGRMSLFTEREKFTLPVEDPSAPGGFRQETIETLADIRRLERESEQAERNGEGRRMVWRDYSQDPSNRDVHTLGADPSLKPAKHYTNGEKVVVRRGDPVIADHGTLEEAP